MRILAIDPGPEQSAFVFWDTKKHDFLGPGMGIENSFRLALWLAPKGLVLKHWKVDLFAIEMIQNYGKNFSPGRDIFKTCLVVGQLKMSVILGNLDHAATVKLYGRPTIKGHFQARTDADIRASLRLRYGEARKGQKLEGVKKDIWSALALAVALEENPNLKEW